MNWHEQQTSDMEASIATVDDLLKGDDALMRAMNLAASEPFYGHHIFAVASAFAINTPLRIIDVGCGTGIVANALGAALPNATVVGVDDHEPSLAKARRTAPPNVEYRRARIEELSGGEWDVVVASEVYEHVERPNLMLASLHGVMKEGGMLILSTPSAWMTRQPRIRNLALLARDPRTWWLQAFPERDWSAALAHHPGSRWLVLRRALQDAGFIVTHRGSSCLYVDPSSRSLLWLVRRGGRKSIALALAEVLGRGNQVREAATLRAIFQIAEGAMTLLAPLRFLESRIMVVAHAAPGSKTAK